MLDSDVSVCMARQILLDFHKLSFLSNASFAAPENVERMFHIRREDERETGKFSSSLMSNSKNPICVIFARTSAWIRECWELRGKYFVEILWPDYNSFEIIADLQSINLLVDTNVRGRTSFTQKLEIKNCHE